jgi:pSer/pThr/pTyr-binding forkhead associated (FHA) protein
VWRRADGTEVAFALTGDAHVVGRDPEAADLVVDEPLVSRAHARLLRRGEAWVLCDLDSTNRTRVNGEVLRAERDLQPGDELLFARAVCRFEAGAPDAAATAPAAPGPGPA